MKCLSLHAKNTIVKKIFVNHMIMFFGLKEVRSKISILMETTGAIFHWRGFKKCFLQFKTLRRVIYIPLEGFRYPSWGFIIPLEGFSYSS